MSEGGAWHGEALGKWELSWRKMEGFCENGIPSFLLTLLSPVEFPIPAAPLLGWHLRLFAWSPGPVQPEGKQVYNGLRGEKSSEPGCCAVPALGLGRWKKAPVANPEPAWADSPLPRTPPDKHGSEERSLPPFERNHGPEGGQGAGEEERGRLGTCSLGIKRIAF